MIVKRNAVSSQSTLSVLIVNRNNEQMLLMYFRFACSRDIFRCNQLLYGTGPFWKYSRSLSKELDLLLILNSNQEFKWSPRCEEAFKKAKYLLSSSNVLAHYDPSLPVILESDASGQSYFTASLMVMSDLSHMPPGP